jgi:NADH dehydrogenase
VFAVGGSGAYRVRPIHVEDLAGLALEAAGWPDDRAVDAVGPERPTFRELVGLVRDAVGSRARIVRVPGPVVLVSSRIVGAVVHDVLLTRDEYRSMADGLADSDAGATGSTRLSEWLAGHGPMLGQQYANELDLHFRA